MAWTALRMSVRHDSGEALCAVIDRVDHLLDVIDLRGLRGVELADLVDRIERGKDLQRPASFRGSAPRGANVSNRSGSTISAREMHLRTVAREPRALWRLVPSRSVCTRLPVADVRPVRADPCGSVRTVSVRTGDLLKRLENCDHSVTAGLSPAL